jgi:hypothetical protein
MRLRDRTVRIGSYAVVAIGVLLGIFSFARTGSLLVALGTLGIAVDARHSRKIEFFLPLAIALALFAVAIALPHGR